jgi:hypothetical protein
VLLRPAAYVAAALSALVIVGCDGGAEPSAPPTSEPALTTATATPDAVAETSEAEATTAEPAETATASATEDSAEGFVETYIATLSAVHMEEADVQELRALASDTCKTCAAFADAADAKRFGHAYMKHVNSSSVILGEEARVETVIEQVSDGAQIDTVFTLTWEEERWLVSEIQLLAG